MVFTLKIEREVMNYITHLLKVDYSIFIELCSYHGNQFETHHSKEKLNNPQSPSLLSYSPAPGIPMNLLSVFTNLLIQDILYNCHQQYVVLWECFLFSVHIKFSRLDHVHKFRLSVLTHKGTGRSPRTCKHCSCYSCLCHHWAICTTLRCT